MEKKRLFAAISMVLLVCGTLAITQISCKSDPCNSVKCQNGGTCANGICTCPTGYSGTDCQTAYNAPFLGTFAGTYKDSANALPNHDTIVIATGTGAYAVIITDKVKALTFNGTVSGADSVNIPAQTVNFSGFPGTVTGYGTVFNGVATFTYARIVTINSGSDTITTTFTGVKQ